MGSKRKNKDIKSKQLNNKETDRKAQINKKYRTDILKCLIYAVLIELYFITFSIINTSIPAEAFNICVKVSYLFFIFISIIMFEIAYKKQNNSFTITGIEFIALAIHTLLINRSIDDTQNILGTSYIWLVYYCLKAGVIQTKENQRKLKQISDISEIVKEEKPLKKVAKKRKK